MVRRLVPLVIAIAIAFAPVALEACQTSCALHDAMRVKTGHHPAAHEPASASSHEAGHRCHDMAMPEAAAPDSSTAFTGLPHACAHSDELPLSGGVVLVAALAPPLTCTALDVPPVQPSMRVDVSVDALSLSDRIAATTQLRV